MAHGLSSGRFRFRPRIGWALVTAAAIAAFIALGNWQSRRAEEKAELSRRFAAAERVPALALAAMPQEPSAIEYRRVSVRGRFLPGETLYLDNQVRDGVAGYDVLTPLQIEGGRRYLLVDRGWIAAGDRRRLPAVPTPEETQTIEGIVVVPSRRFFEIAPESPLGPLRQHLVIEREEERLRLPLEPFVVRQTSAAADGLLRRWPPPDTGVAMHRSYALQWYSFAVLAAILYVALGFERNQDARDGG